MIWGGCSKKIYQSFTPEFCALELTGNEKKAKELINLIREVKELGLNYVNDPIPLNFEKNMNYIDNYLQK